MSSTGLWNNPVQPTGGYANGYSGVYGAANGGYGATAAATRTIPVGANDQYDPCEPTDATQPTGAANAVEDFTGQGSVRLEDTDMYQRALTVSDSRVVEDPVVPCDGYRQKVIRRVEVPYTRKVKVPVKTQKIVEGTIRQRVPTKRLVEVPVMKLVDEEYTEFEEREAVREKEIWVRQIVPEKYIERVPVKKVRQVSKPGTEVREVEEWVEVEVPTSRVMEVEGFRVDDVDDTKVVEVEEYQEMEAVWQPKGAPILARTRELGRVPGSHLARTAGAVVVDEAAEGLDQLDLDSNPDGAGAVRAQRAAPQQRAPQGGQFAGSGSYYRGQSDYRPGNTASNVFATSTYTDPKFIRPAGDFQKAAGANIQQTANPGSLGLTVKNTHTRHTDGTGVQVTAITRGGPAARAGILENDIITSANGQRTITVAAFANAVKGASSVTVTVNRDGRRNVPYTFSPQA